MLGAIRHWNDRALLPWSAPPGRRETLLSSGVGRMLNPICRPIVGVGRRRRGP